MKNTLYCYIPLAYEDALNESVMHWEAENEGYKAIIVGSYKPSALTEPTNTFVTIGSHQIAKDVWYGSEVIELSGFCIVADSDQLSEYTINQISAIGNIFDAPEKYKEFELTL